MSGFVRGGPRARGGSERDETHVVITEVAREVIEVPDTDPMIVHLVEPVLVGGSGGAADIDARFDAVDVQIEGLVAADAAGAQRDVGQDLALASHRVASEPHAEYDDMVSLRLIFENGLI